MLSPERVRLRTALVDVLLGDAAKRAAAASTLTTSHAWEDAVTLAAHWHVAEPLSARIRDREDVLPTARARLRAVTAAIGAHSTLTIHRALRTFDILESAGIPTLAFKGVAAIAQLYGSPARRHVGDFDCLVEERIVRDAERTLLESGFICTNVPLEAHMRAIETSPRLHNYARTYVSDGFEVDLHWRFGTRPPAPLRSENLIARASFADLAGTRVRVPHPVDAQLLAVHHAMRGGFSTTTTVKDIGDLVAWWNVRFAEWDLDELIERAIACALGGSLLALWSVVVTRDPDHPIAAGIERLRTSLPASERRAGECLARFFEAQIRNGDYATRTIEMFALPRLTRRGLSELAMRIDRRLGLESAAAGAPNVRQPFAKRTAGFVGRSWRVVRDLTDIRQLGAFAAVARAQSRFR